MNIREMMESLLGQDPERREPIEYVVLWLPGGLQSFAVDGGIRALPKAEMWDDPVAGTSLKTSYVAQGAHAFGVFMATSEVNARKAFIDWLEDCEKNGIDPLQSDKVISSATLLHEIHESLSESRKKYRRAVAKRSLTRELFKFGEEGRKSMAAREEEEPRSGIEVRVMAIPVDSAPGELLDALVNRAHGPRLPSFDTRKDDKDYGPN